jgi:hypothetical protein
MHELISNAARIARWQILLLCMALPVTAQSTFGSIVGAVNDASGAAATGVTITARLIDENTARTAVSDGQGLYEVINLKPGRYEISAAKAGFATSTIAEARLEARQTLRADFKLELAAVEQSVLVADRLLPLINTENAIIADTKTFEQITQLPLNYRGATTSPLIATMIVPGAQHDFQNQVSLAGGLPAQIEYSMDGISTKSVLQTGPNYDMVPSTEMLSEFKVTSVNNSAEFGSMGDVTVITRGGSNKLHGSALWYHQNAALDATAYGSPGKQKKVFNTFGGSLSGAVWRDRTFFFVDYEGNRQPRSYLEEDSVPTATMRRGDLNGLPGGEAVDPLSGSPFPGNQIPASRINSVARALLDKYYPLPNYNFNGTTNTNYRKLIPTPNDTDGYDVRVDHILNSRQQIFGRWSWKQIASPYGNPLLPISIYDELNRNLIVSHNYSIRPNLLNEFRFGFGLSDSQEHFPVLAADAVATLGLEGLDLSNSRGAGGFPGFDFSAGTGFAPIGHGRTGPFRSTNWQSTDSLTWIRGPHSMKFGFDLRYVGYAQILDPGFNEFGNFVFNQVAFSGNAFADLLLGLPYSNLYAILGPNISERAIQTHLYAQDEWYVNNRLTLTYGLRWSLHPPMIEGSGNITNFDRTNGDVITPDHTLPAAPGFLQAINACPGITNSIPCTHIVTASQASLGEGLRQTYYGNWDPRLSLAWRPFSNNKTVVRSGFGIFTQSVLGQLAYDLTGVHTSDFRTFTNFQAHDTPPVFVLPQVSGGSFPLPSVGTENFLTAINPGYKDPRTYQWSFTVERELPWHSALRVSYIGSETVGANLLVDLNQQQASKIPFSANKRPYPAWHTVMSRENLGYASYNGLQVEGSHRFSRGLFFQSSYVFSRNIGNAGSAFGGFFFGNAFPPETFPRPITDRFDTRLDRGDLAGSRRQRFLFTGIYPLPIGHGRTFASRMNPFFNAILGGWDLSTITLVQSGTFETPAISASADQSNTNQADRSFAGRPDRIGNGNLPNPTPDRWWDPSAFVPTPKGAGRFGNSGVGVLVGPGSIAIAGGLFKNFSITERLRMRIETTFTNLPNHPNWGIPGFFVDEPGFGQITNVQTGENSGNRVGQVGARLDF